MWSSSSASLDSIIPTQKCVTFGVKCGSNENILILSSFVFRRHSTHVFVIGEKSRRKISPKTKSECNSCVFRPSVESFLKLVTAIDTDFAFTDTSRLSSFVPEGDG